VLLLYRERVANSKGNASSEWSFLRKEKAIEIMSAEESDKRKPISEGLERALKRLAQETVRNGWDPGKVAMALYTMLQRWSELTPEQREAVRRELARRRVPRVAKERKPRYRGQQP
jgi:hypothetical protein